MLIGGQPVPSELLEIPVDAIHPNPRQPRRRFEPEAASGLAESVRRQGVIQPLLVRRRLNPSLEIGGVLLTMVDGRTRLAQQVEEEVRRHFGPLVFRTSVPRSVRLAEAPSHGLPAIAYDRRSAGADAYWKVAMELVERQ